MNNEETSMGIYSEIKMPAGWEGWELTEEIGSGSFGTVYKAIDKESGTVSADGTPCAVIPASPVI